MFAKIYNTRDAVLALASDQRPGVAMYMLFRLDQALCAYILTIGIESAKENALAQNTAVDRSIRIGWRYRKLCHDTTAHVGDGKIGIGYIVGKKEAHPRRFIGRRRGNRKKGIPNGGTYFTDG